MPYATWKGHRRRWVPMTGRWRSIRPSRLRSEEHTSELQSLTNLVCRLLLEKKKIAHARQRELRSRHDATEVDGELRCGGRVALVREETHMLDPRVVDEDVQRAKVFFHLAE